MSTNKKYKSYTWCNKKKVPLVIFFFIQTSFVEVIGIGLVGPYIGMIVNPEVILSNSYIWKSDGKTGFTISAGDRSANGTTITLYLNDGGEEFINRWTIDRIVKKYSNHVSFPIFLHYTEKKNSEGENSQIEEDKCEQMNEASAFWKKSKSSLKKKDYIEFYKTLTNNSDEPMLNIHTQAEGTLDYTTLFYIPSKAPFDLFQSDYKPGVKLYVKRVFITDEDKDLMPVYLRFIKGIIDSEDLPLNVSREI